MFYTVYHNYLKIAQKLNLYYRAIINETHYLKGVEEIYKSSIYKVD